MLTLQEIYHLPLRGTCGFTESIFTLLKLALPVPGFSQLSRRRQTLAVKLPCARSKAPLHLVIDSTGIKVYSEGEWKVHQYGDCYRRTWRKLQLAIDGATHMIHAAIVTTNHYSDGQLLPELLE